MHIIHRFVKSGLIYLYSLDTLLTFILLFIRLTFASSAVHVVHFVAHSQRICGGFFEFEVVHELLS